MPEQTQQGEGREQRELALLWLAGGYRLIAPTREIWEGVRELVTSEEDYSNA